MSGFARELELKEITKTDIPVFHVGDTVEVGVRIVEGDKPRTQMFIGVVIARKGTGLRETFTVRRLVEGEGVERVFPLHSPNVASIKVVRAGQVRRAKLYYLRDRVGKATRIKENVRATHLGSIDASKIAAREEEKAPVAEADPAVEEPAEEKVEATAET